MGCTDEGLRKELTQLKESGVEIEALQIYGGTTSLKYKIFNEEVTHTAIVAFIAIWQGIAYIANNSIVLNYIIVYVSVQMLCEWYKPEKS